MDLIRAGGGYMQFKDVILVDCEDFKKAISVLEKAGIEVSIPVSRRAYYIE